MALDLSNIRTLVVNGNGMDAEDWMIPSTPLMVEVKTYLTRNAHGQLVQLVVLDGQQYAQVPQNAMYGGIDNWQPPPPQVAPMPGEGSGTVELLRIGRMTLP